MAEQEDTFASPLSPTPVTATSTERARGVTTPTPSTTRLQRVTNTITSILPSRSGNPSVAGSRPGTGAGINTSSTPQGSPSLAGKKTNSTPPPTPIPRASPTPVPAPATPLGDYSPTIPRHAGAFVAGSKYREMSEWRRLEESVTAKRIEKCQQTLEKILGPTPHNGRQPRVAMCFSGGGWRAMASGVAVLDALSTPLDPSETCANESGLKLLDVITHLFGLSGGSWAILTTLAGGERNPFHTEPTSAPPTEVDRAAHPWIHGQKNGFNPEVHDYRGLRHMTNGEHVNQACYKRSNKSRFVEVSSRIADITFPTVLTTGSLGSTIIERWCNFMANDLLSFVDGAELNEPTEAPPAPTSVPPSPSASQTKDSHNTTSSNNNNSNRVAGTKAVPPIVEDVAAAVTATAAVNLEDSLAGLIVEDENPESELTGSDGGGVNTVSTEKAVMEVAKTDPNKDNASRRVKLSDLRKLIDNGDFPFVVASAIADSAAPTQKRVYDWVEFTPYFLRRPATAQFTTAVDDICAYYSPADREAEKPSPPLRLHNYMGICGSAFACDLSVIIRQSSHRKLSQHIPPLRTNPILGTGTSDLQLPDNTSLGIIRDAGIDINVPFPPVLSESQREFDIIVVLDSGCGTKSAYELELAVAMGYIALMPSSSPVATKFDKDQYVRVYRGINGYPTIIYFIGLTKWPTSQVIHRDTQVMKDLQMLRTRVLKQLIPVLMAQLRISKARNESHGTIARISDPSAQQKQDDNKNKPVNVVAAPAPTTFSSPLRQKRPLPPNAFETNIAGDHSGSTTNTDTDEDECAATTNQITKEPTTRYQTPLANVKGKHNVNPLRRSKYTISTNEELFNAVAESIILTAGIEGRLVELIDGHFVIESSVFGGVPSHKRETAIIAMEMAAIKVITSVNIEAARDSLVEDEPLKQKQQEEQPSLARTTTPTGDKSKNESTTSLQFMNSTLAGFTTTTTSSSLTEALAPFPDIVEMMIELGVLTKVNVPMHRRRHTLLRQEYELVLLDSWVDYYAAMSVVRHLLPPHTTPEMVEKVMTCLNRRGLSIPSATTAQFNQIVLVSEARPDSRFCMMLGSLVSKLYHRCGVDCSGVAVDILSRRFLEQLRILRDTEKAKREMDVGTSVPNDGVVLTALDREEILVASMAIHIIDFFSASLSMRLMVRGITLLDAKLLAAFGAMVGSILGNKVIAGAAMTNDDVVVRLAEAAARHPSHNTAILLHFLMFSTSEKLDSWEEQNPVLSRRRAVLMTLPLGTSAHNNNSNRPSSSSTATRGSVSHRQSTAGKMEEHGLLSILAKGCNSSDNNAHRLALLRVLAAAFELPDTHSQKLKDIASLFHKCGLSLDYHSAVNNAFSFATEYFLTHDPSELLQANDTVHRRRNKVRSVLESRLDDIAAVRSVLSSMTPYARLLNGIHIRETLYIIWSEAAASQGFRQQIAKLCVDQQLYCDFMAHFAPVPLFIPKDVSAAKVNQALAFGERCRKVIRKVQAEDTSGWTLMQRARYERLNSRVLHYSYEVKESIVGTAEAAAQQVGRTANEAAMKAKGLVTVLFNRNKH